MQKTGRNECCPCGSDKKYKKCCLDGDMRPIPKEVMEYFQNLPQEPFERGGFLTGRPFVSTVFQGGRMRAIANRIYQGSLDETFHVFILRRFFNTLTQVWVETEEKKDLPHILIQWAREMQGKITTSDLIVSGVLRGVKLTGSMRSLLAIAYDFYTLEHCNSPVPQSLLNRLRNKDQFQGARYEIAIAGLVVRSGFEIKWQGGKKKHCEFIGKHKVTGEKAAFEVKSHHRDGVLGQDGSFDAQAAGVKIMDHIRDAMEQAPIEDIPLVIFNDLNLPLTANVPLGEKRWFKEVEGHLRKYGFNTKTAFKRCAVLFVTNFSWHFHYKIPPEHNELVVYFHTGGAYSLRPDTILQYLDLAAKQYGFVPSLEYEFKDK